MTGGLDPICPGDFRAELSFPEKGETLPVPASSSLPFSSDFSRLPTRSSILQASALLQTSEYEFLFGSVSLV